MPRWESRQPKGSGPGRTRLFNEVPRIRARQALGDVERAAGLIEVNLRSGTDSINSRDVHTLIMHDRMEELLSMATSTDAASVKQRAFIPSGEGA